VDNFSGQKNVENAEVSNFNGFDRKSFPQRGGGKLVCKKWKKAV
jgi:hypothetical protein